MVEESRPLLGHNNNDAEDPVTDDSAPHHVYSTATSSHFVKLKDDVPIGNGSNEWISESDNECREPPSVERFDKVVSLPPLDRDAVHFGVRMSACITVACLFILLRPPGEELHQAIWIVITVHFVCWFPSLDAASVVEKSLQRLYGTFVGAASGLSCGFLSLAILKCGHEEESGYSVVAQSAFLIFCIATYTFLVCWAAIQYTVGPNNTKIIAKYDYACILSLLTFYICVLPFYSDEEPKWSKGSARVLNVIVGCFLGAGLSISILPRSSAKVIDHKMKRQIQLAGEAAQAVLHMAAESFSDKASGTRNPVCRGAKAKPTSIALDAKSSGRHRRTNSRREWRPAFDGEDLALSKYESAIQEWRSIKAQLANLRYDPFFLGTPDVLLDTFRNEMNHTLARALRIQNTVLLLDGIIRNDPKHDFSDKHIHLFVETGDLICLMLKSPSSSESYESAEAAFTKLTDRLAEIRRSTIELSSVVAMSSQEVPVEQLGTLGVGILASSPDLVGMEEAFNNVETGVVPKINHEASIASLLQQDDDDQGRGFPKFFHGNMVCALLFLQLVEHLMLRSIRLYQSWKDCRPICEACQKNLK